MTTPITTPEEDRLEALMYQRLGREHGITDTTCPKCLHYRLRKVAPQLQLPLLFGFAFGPYSFNWLKARMDSYARGAPRVWIPHHDLETLLHQSNHEPTHLDHLPPGARNEPIFLMHVKIPEVGVVPVISDGQHRATLALHEGHNIGAIILSEHIEPRCRATEADILEQMEIAQRNGMLTYEVPVQYAVMRRGKRVVFGRIVALPEISDGDIAYFQPARNAQALERQAAALVPAGDGSVMLAEVDMYAALSRKAKFASHMSIGPSQLAQAIPITRQQIMPGAKMLEVPPPGRGVRG
jgi:hypothetical protein